MWLFTINTTALSCAVKRHIGYERINFEVECKISDIFYWLHVEIIAFRID
jgi:hypothetical protein